MTYIKQATHLHGCCTEAHSNIITALVISIMIIIIDYCNRILPADDNVLHIPSHHSRAGVAGAWRSYHMAGNCGLWHQPDRGGSHCPAPLPVWGCLRAVQLIPLARCARAMFLFCCAVVIACFCHWNRSMVSFGCNQTQAACIALSYTAAFAALLV